ncbi:MAG: nucleoside kinase [Bacteroidaceae bacterium]|nr:nucleoside kinase [Bacteroidaceae bacterium]
MNTTTPASINLSRSSEKFEVNGAYLKVSEQMKEELKQKPLDEAIQYLVGRVKGRYLFSKRLKTVCFSIGTMNRVIDQGDADKMVRVAEALQVRGIDLIGDAIAARPQVKGVLIAGPSSSGKTTFSKKLSLALQRHGLEPMCISFDDYYVDREKTPLDESGDYDYEHINAINIDFFHQQIRQLFQGEEVELPRYDFPTGKSVPSGKRLRLTPRTILILEGIHALNPIITGGAPTENLFRIYISGLTVAKNDDGTYTGTTDNRLIRRMVRDAQFRNTTASETLARWPSVRRGEERWITPFQSEADVNFCTAFQYELGVLKMQALPLLYNVRKNDPNYEEAQRLKWVLHRFHDIPVDLLPPHSLLREFMGGSAFEY